MPNQRCAVNDARTRLPELLDDAARGTSTIITRRGRPVAAVVPLEAVPAPPTGSLLQLEGTGAGLWGPDVGSAIDVLRQEWP